MFLRGSLRIPISGILLRVTNDLPATSLITAICHLLSVQQGELISQWWIRSSEGALQLLNFHLKNGVVLSLFLCSSPPASDLATEAALFFWVLAKNGVLQTFTNRLCGARAWVQHKPWCQLWGHIRLFSSPQVSTKAEIALCNPGIGSRQCRPVPNSSLVIGRGKERVEWCVPPGIFSHCWCSSAPSSIYGVGRRRKKMEHWGARAIGLLPLNSLCHCYLCSLQRESSG